MSILASDAKSSGSPRLAVYIGIFSRKSSIPRFVPTKICRNTTFDINSSRSVDGSRSVESRSVDRSRSVDGARSDWEPLWSSST